MTAPRPRPRLTDSRACPVCHTTVRHMTPRSGEDWVTCTPRGWVKRPDAVCHACWWNVTLPPGMTAGHLAAWIGEAEARALLWAALPEWRGLDGGALWDRVLVPATATAPAWLQLLVPPEMVRDYRFAPLREILVAAGVLAAA